MSGRFARARARSDGEVRLLSGAVGRCRTPFECSQMAVFARKSGFAAPEGHLPGFSGISRGMGYGNCVSEGGAWCIAFGWEPSIHRETSWAGHDRQPRESGRSPTVSAVSLPARECGLLMGLRPKGPDHAKEANSDVQHCSCCGTVERGLSSERNDRNGDGRRRWQLRGHQ